MTRTDEDRPAKLSRTDEDRPAKLSRTDEDRPAKLSRTDEDRPAKLSRMGEDRPAKLSRMGEDRPAKLSRMGETGLCVALSATPTPATVADLPGNLGRDLAEAEAAIATTKRAYYDALSRRNAALRALARETNQ